MRLALLASTIVCVFLAAARVHLGSPAASAAAALTPTAFVPPPECHGDTRRSDDAAITEEILSEKTAAVLFDPNDWEETRAQVAEVLATVRSVFPAARSIHAPDTYPWPITIRIIGPYAEETLANFGQEGTIWVEKTGDDSIDDLNNALGLKAMIVGWYNGLVGAQLCLDHLVNAKVAVDQYEALANISEARLPIIPGDWPRLDARERDGVWYVVVREAGGDCSSGCIFERLTFFRVSGSGVAQMTDAEALAEPLTVSLAQIVRGGRPAPWPTQNSIWLGLASPTSANTTVGQLPMTGGDPKDTATEGWTLWLLAGALLAVSAVSFAQGRRR